jgi:hypothetical protein
MSIKRWISIPFQKEGVHYYPGADTAPELATGDQYDVSFLGTPHFHYFYFTVKIEVFHDDRDLEFIQFRRWCENLYSSGVIQMANRSCEMLAGELHDRITEKWPNRDMVISVAEDNINMAVIEFSKDLVCCGKGI